MCPVFLKKENKEQERECQELQSDLNDLTSYLNSFSSFLPLAVCTVNPAGIIIDINKAFTNLTGFEVVDVVGKPLKSLFLEKEKLALVLEKITGSRKPITTRELTLLTKLGKKISVDFSAQARIDKVGRYVGCFVALSDITEFRKFQEELEKSVKKKTRELQQKTEDLMRSREALMNILEDVQAAREASEEERDRTLAIIENFTDGLLLFDNHNLLLLINPQAQEFFGVKSQDIIEKSLSDLRKVKSLQPLVKLLGKEIRGFFRKELDLGKNLILEVSAIPIIIKGKKSQNLVILHNVTREKTVERLKTEFVSISAHQLRTPLSAIKWTLRMLLDGDIGKISSDQRNILEKAYKSNERMIKLINDLLDVTRIEEGRFLYNIKKADFIKIVKGVISALRDVAKKSKLTLHLLLPSNKIPEVKVDAEKISLAVQNLIENAVHYTPAGGKVTVSIKYDKEHKEVLFSVEDTGIGIPESQQKRVFSKFFRSPNAIRKETVGTGLGLFTTKNIVEAHGGKIWFKSKEGKGTTFYFSLPVKR